MRPNACLRLLALHVPSANLMATGPERETIADRRLTVTKDDSNDQ